MRGPFCHPLKPAKRMMKRDKVAMIACEEQLHGEQLRMAREDSEEQWPIKVVARSIVEK